MTVEMLITGTLGATLVSSAARSAALLTAALVNRTVDFASLTFKKIIKFKSVSTLKLFEVARRYQIIIKKFSEWVM